ncbi:hypothetical protein GCM10009789_32670 [Kribbella sancticallisti]|uniref:SnoaL-like domain-containing protein n=2 Tax=Kribbella sancticallisti TaxID=460087 RepID=A0ABP4PCM3_9ACTN
MAPAQAYVDAVARGDLDGLVNAFHPDGQKLLVRWAPAGSDGWLAHYDFTRRGDRISVANLQYA